MTTPQHIAQPINRGASFGRPSPGLMATVAALCVMLATGLAMSPLLTSSFLSQNDRQFILDAHRGLSVVWRAPLIFLGQVSLVHEAGATYQPLARLSLLLDSWVSRDPMSRLFYFHLTNLLLHALNACLAFVLLRRLSGSIGWAAVLALVFALHPAQVASIAGIAQRSMLLATTFAMLSVCSYLRFVAGGRRRWLWVTSLLYVVAALCGPVWVLLPMLLIVLDIWPLNRLSRSTLLEKLPLLTIMVVFAMIAIQVRRLAPPVALADIGALPLIGLNIVSLIVRMFHPSSLSPMYPLQDEAEAPAHLSVILLIPLLVVFGWSCVRSRPVFALMSAVGLLLVPAFLELPFTNALLPDAVLYTVLLVPPVAVAVLFRRHVHDGRILIRRSLMILVAGLAAWLGVQSYVYAFTWQNPRDVYSQVVQQHPQWAGGYVGLVEACIAENDLDAALIYARRAVRIDASDPNTQFYLGTVLLLHRDDRSVEAIAPLKKALASNASWIECLQNMGVALARAGRTEDAIHYLEKARDLEPDSASIRIGLGHAYLRVNRAASARREFQEALQHQNDAVVHLGLAMAWAASDMPELARRHLAIAVARDPASSTRAAGFEALSRLRDRKGFGELIPAPSSQISDGEPSQVDLPAARQASGS